MRVGTWNVNGIRARNAQVLDWIARERPDVVCLQEIKARPDQLAPLLFEPEDYWCRWHGTGGYSGVALFVRRGLIDAPPEFASPAFDIESRILTVTVDETTVASIYVPNGGKDYDAKLRFLDALIAWVTEAHREGRTLLLCGDFNVAHTERDLHPKERKAGGIGQRPEERQRIDALLAGGLVDVGRTLAPDTDTMYTWWAPWRNLRQRNIGWRIDLLLASRSLAARAVTCPVLADVGTSDHAPVLGTFADARGSGPVVEPSSSPLPG